MRRVALLLSFVVVSLVYLSSTRPVYALLCDTLRQYPTDIDLVMVEVKDKKLQCDHGRILNKLETLFVLKGKAGPHFDVATQTEGRCPLRETATGEIIIEIPDVAGAPPLLRFEVGKKYLLSVYYQRGAVVDTINGIPACYRIATEVAGLYDPKVWFYMLRVYIPPLLWLPGLAFVLLLAFALQKWTS